MLYTSLENIKIKEINKLNNKKYRDKQNEFLIESKHLVEEAYKKGYLKTLIVEENDSFKLDIDTIYVTKDILKHIADTQTPQNIMGICKKLIENDNYGNNILALDNIQDPGNMGTIIRSAVAFNIDTIILGDGCVDIYNPKVVRASQGMIFNINIVKKNLKEFIKKVDKEYKIIGTKVTGGKDIKTLEKFEKTCIIMGNEGNGISDEILNLCNEYIYIPMNSDCESLNVGVATSIILYELNK